MTRVNAPMFIAGSEELPGARRKNIATPAVPRTSTAIPTTSGARPFMPPAADLSYAIKPLLMKSREVVLPGADVSTPATSVRAAAFCDAARGSALAEVQSPTEEVLVSSERP